MKISQILENAKAFLITEEESDNFSSFDRGGKTYYICIAAKYYIRSVSIEGTSREAILDLTEPVSSFIEQKIADSNSGSYITLPNEIAKKLLGLGADDYMSPALKQKARHIWIDQLIAELKANPERDLNIELDLN